MTLVVAERLPYPVLVTDRSEQVLKSRLPLGEENSGSSLPTKCRMLRSYFAAATSLTRGPLRLTRLQRLEALLLGYRATARRQHLEVK
jgi:hypothetical protein